MISLQKIVKDRITLLSRQEWVFLLTAIGMLLGAVLSLPVWTSVRTFPLAPILSTLSAPPLVHSILFVVFFVSLLASIRYQSHRFFLLCLALLSLGFMCALDITRFQPWIFYYASLLCLFAIGSYSGTASEKILDAARILIGGMYFWSGVQKLNVSFFTIDFPWFTQPLWSTAPDVLLPPFLFFGLVVPFLEIGLALGLFFVRTRTVAVYGSLCMMLLVLFCLGPLGHSWNTVVWPWNLILFLTTLTVFWRTDFTFSTFFIRQKQNLLGLSMFCLFWLMPIGNVFGVVDHYVAWSLYSGKAPEATLHGDPVILSSLSSESSGTELKFARWTNEELHVVPYPEVRVFTAVFHDLCERFDNDPALLLEIEQSRSYFITNKTYEHYQCTNF